MTNEQIQALKVGDKVTLDGVRKGAVELVANGHVRVKWTDRLEAYTLHPSSPLWEKMELAP